MVKQTIQIFCRVKPTKHKTGVSMLHFTGYYSQQVFRQQNIANSVKLNKSNHKKTITVTSIVHFYAVSHVQVTRRRNFADFLTIK